MISICGKYLSAYPDARLYGGPTLVRLNRSLAFAELSKRRAKNFLRVVLDDCAVSNNDPSKAQFMYPFHRRAHVVSQRRHDGVRNLFSMVDAEHHHPPKII
jgi:hypothetical protein